MRLPQPGSEDHRGSTRLSETGKGCPVRGGVGGGVERVSSLGSGLGMVRAFQGIRRLEHAPDEGRRAGRPDVLPCRQRELSIRKDADLGGWWVDPQDEGARLSPRTPSRPTVVASSGRPALPVSEPHHQIHN